MEYEYWQTCDYGREGKKVKFSKASLGIFFYNLFLCRGEVTSSMIMNKDYHNCYCQFAIKLPKGSRPTFERLSGFILEPIAQLSLA